jgi:hypothetical protein
MESQSVNRRKGETYLDKLAREEFEERRAAARRLAWLIMALWSGFVIVVALLAKW